MINNDYYYYLITVTMSTAPPVPAVRSTADARGRITDDQLYDLSRHLASRKMMTIIYNHFRLGPPYTELGIDNILYNVTAKAQKMDKDYSGDPVQDFKRVPDIMHSATYRVLLLAQLKTQGAFVDMLYAAFQPTDRFSVFEMAIVKEGLCDIFDI